MSDNDLVLVYRRLNLAYDGFVKTPETEESRVVFEQCDFHKMMWMVHDLLLHYPDSGLQIQRSESANLMPIHLQADMLELLRTDPSRYIQMHSIPPRTVDLRSSPKRKSALSEATNYVMPRTIGLRAGCDTLAAAFGETIYLRMRQARVEHPATGRWVRLHEIEEFIGSQHNIEVVITKEAAEVGWVTIRLIELLATKADRFYLPREWNVSGPWITREQLNELHQQFLEEKGALICHSEVTTAS